MTGAAPGRQIGWFRADGSVETASSPAANNPNLLVETVVLNYMALHGEQSQFTTAFPSHGLGGASLRALAVVRAADPHRAPPAQPARPLNDSRPLNGSRTL